MANPYTSVSAVNYNASPPPDDGSTGSNNEITWAGIKSKLADVLKTEADAINSNVLSAFAKIFGANVSAISTDYTVQLTDQGKLLSCTGSHTITLPAVASAASPFCIAVVNSGSGTTTIDGNASETIDTALTITLKSRQFAILVCDGSAWTTLNNRAPVLTGYLNGLTNALNTGAPNTKIDIAAGQATDDGNIALISLASTVTIDSGTVGANGLDTGTLGATTTYFTWVISKLDGTTAALLSTSSTSPTLPSGYVFKRRIGRVTTDGSSHFTSSSVVTVPQPTRTTLTSGTGTYTTPTGCIRLYVRMIGGGGGGAGSGTGAGVGSSGGNTTFGTTFLTCNGGSGASGGSGGAGGTSSGGLDLTGGDGASVPSATVGVGGAGGVSLFGGGGVPNGGAAKSNSGSGGGGGSAAGTAAPGGGGGAGGYLDAVITAPLTSYAYSVGAAGNGGSAGTSGFAGGNGGSSQIIIDEFYI